MKYRVYVDGQEGTTGLKIYERLSLRNDIEILRIDPDKRKDLDERKKYLNSADIVFLCLPDVASKEAVSMIDNSDVIVIDASTAHRTNDEWAYGIPELSQSHREKISNSKRIATAGCYATGFNMLMYPLVSSGIVPSDYPVSCHAVSGYSGGGRSLIEKYQNSEYVDKFKSPAFYALGLNHKHLPEMKKFSCLDSNPIFTPILGNYYNGMTVSVPLRINLLNKKYSAKDLRDFLADYYNQSRFVKVMPFSQDDILDEGKLTAERCINTNKLEIFVFGNDEQILVASSLDNLGKGASGAAIQNMNIVLGLDEGLGLE